MEIKCLTVQTFTKLQQASKKLFDDQYEPQMRDNQDEIFSRKRLYEVLYKNRIKNLIPRAKQKNIINMAEKLRQIRSRTRVEDFNTIINELEAINKYTHK